MNPYQAPTMNTTPGVSHPAEGRDLKWLMLSFDGRIGRAEFWKGSLILFGFVIVLVGVIAGIGAALSNDMVGSILLLVGCVPLMWASLAVQVKRWHDRGKSGWWIFIGMVPFIGGIWSFVETGILRGTEGDNGYGVDPVAL